jgi:hypothetical protein
MLSPLSLPIAGFLQESPAIFYVSIPDFSTIFSEKMKIQKATGKYGF